MNRQVIVLMSGLKVPDTAFMKLQDAMLLKLANMLVNEEAAAEAISQSQVHLT